MSGVCLADALVSFRLVGVSKTDALQNSLQLANLHVAVPALVLMVREHDEDSRAVTLAGARRPAHYGLDIQFDDRPDDLDLGRLVESTVWVNRAHPAYRRALASRAVGYHIALTVAMASLPPQGQTAQAAGAFSTRRVTTQFLVLDSGRLSLISTTSPMWNSLFSS